MNHQGAAAVYTKNRNKQDFPLWHVLDCSSIWMKEFASALSGIRRTTSWMPEMRATAFLENWERLESLAEPRLRIQRFPLQRGYSRFPISLLSRFGAREARRLAQASNDPSASTLVCTTPFYAPVAERWPGPVVYYSTDLTVAYAGVDSRLVRAMDRRLCRAADLICPNSTRIADYFVNEAGADREKIAVIPNATRAANISAVPLLEPLRLPTDIADLPRPIAGVIGNLAGNLDWTLLADAVNRTPEFSWVFVGPTDMDIPDKEHRAAREGLMSRPGRIRFVGSRPYGALKDYARAIDVAILPYRKVEPTYSGSSTRFYEHLAACRPMLGTRGFEELLHKEPLIKLVEDALELAHGMEALRANGMTDRLEELRWRASQNETWESRAARMTRALESLPSAAARDRDASRVLTGFVSGL